MTLLEVYAPAVLAFRNRHAKPKVGVFSGSIAECQEVFSLMQKHQEETKKAPKPPKTDDAAPAVDTVPPNDTAPITEQPAAETTDADIPDAADAAVMEAQAKAAEAKKAADAAKEAAKNAALAAKAEAKKVTDAAKADAKAAEKKARDEAAAAAKAIKDAEKAAAAAPKYTDAEIEAAKAEIEAVRATVLENITAAKSEFDKIVAEEKAKVDVIREKHKDIIKPTRTKAVTADGKPAVVRSVDRFGINTPSKKSEVAEFLVQGATMTQIKNKFGGTHYSLLGELAELGHHIERDGAIIRLTHKDDVRNKG